MKSKAPHRVNFLLVAGEALWLIGEEFYLCVLMLALRDRHAKYELA